MAAYRRVYDCEEPGSAPEPYAVSDKPLDDDDARTCCPVRVNIFLTAPESSLTASVISDSTWSNECAVLRFSRMRTALRGRLPFRITVTYTGQLSLASLRGRLIEYRLRLG